jgi:Asp-tRNA(Asn)/Glu-tRNA(Gln) amidotransferase A subunit family amidase
MLNRYRQIGPLARSVRDIAMAFSILQGPDGIDGLAVHAKSAEPFDKPIADKGSASDGWSSPVSGLWTGR